MTDAGMTLSGRVFRRTLKRPDGAEHHYFETEVLDGGAPVEGGEQSFAAFEDAVAWLTANGVPLED